MACLASQPPRCITRSIAPPPPWRSCQLKNLVPVTERGPRGVCHRDLSRRSRTAPQERQDDFQRDFANQVGSPPEVVSGHGTLLTQTQADDMVHCVAGYSSIRPRKLSQSFMLIT